VITSGSVLKEEALHILPVSNLHAVIEDHEASRLQHAVELRHCTSPNDFWKLMKQVHDHNLSGVVGGEGRENNTSMIDPDCSRDDLWAQACCAKSLNHAA
jgi:hypothetical protein